MTSPDFKQSNGQKSKPVKFHCCLRDENSQTKQNGPIFDFLKTLNTTNQKYPKKQKKTS